MLLEAGQGLGVISLCGFHGSDLKRQPPTRSRTGAKESGDGKPAVSISDAFKLS